jgi:aminoglycoside phosphotransferase
MAMLLPVKRRVEGSLVKILARRAEDAGLELDQAAGLCVRTGDIHELVTTDTDQSAPGTRIDRVGYLGYVEIEKAGVIDRYDEVLVGAHRVGIVLGFDSRTPGRLSILIHSSRPRTGPELSLGPETPVAFRATDLPEEEPGRPLD